MKTPRLACSDSFGFPCFKVSVCHRLCAFALAAILAFAQDLLAQSATRSIGWVVISVDEYRSLRARAFPSERGAPFAKKGGSELSLPKMDVPISVLNWEVFLPEQYKVKDFGGDAIAMNEYPAVYGMGYGSGIGAGVGGGIGGGVAGGLVQISPGVVGDFVN